MPLTRLTHFTPAINLPSILSDGEIRSVAHLAADVRACYRQTDLARLDGYPDRVCCSLQYPNGFYFDIARVKQAFRNFPDWICLLLDKRAASVEGTLFCPRNAAASTSWPKPGVQALDACYAASVAGQGGMARTRGPLHDPASPTDVQAEVLLPAPVPLSVVHAIVFPEVAAATEEYGRLDRFGMLPLAGMRWVVSAGMFDKGKITTAVQSSRRFPEVDWQQPPSPGALQ